MANLTLGQRVTVNAEMRKYKGGMVTKWTRIPLGKPTTGLVVGKRTVQNGTTEWHDDQNYFTPASYQPVYLVAVSLNQIMRVAPEDIAQAGGEDD